MTGVLSQTIKARTTPYKHILLVLTLTIYLSSSPLYFWECFASNYIFHLIGSLNQSISGVLTKWLLLVLNDQTIKGSCAVSARNNTVELERSISG